MIRPSGLAAALTLAGLVGCAPPATQAPLPGITEPPADFPGDRYRQAQRRGRRVYRIEPGDSRIAVRVHRAGKLAQFGHDHLVSATEVRGFLMGPQGDQAGRGDLYLPVTALQVDRPEAVREAGFGAELSAEDRRATRANMLQEVLEAEQYPYVRIEVGPYSRTPPASPVAVSLTLHGVTRERRIPVRMEQTGEVWTITGELTLHHRAFDMEPYSAMGGALRVKDRLDLSFRLRAKPIGPPTETARTRLTGAEEPAASREVQSP